MIDEGIIVVPKNGIDASQYMRNQPEAEIYCLPEGVVVYTVMRSVALDEKFDTRSSIRSFILSFILNGDGRGLGSEIDYIQRRLALS